VRKNYFYFALVAAVVLGLSGAVEATTSSVTINPVGFAFGVFNGQYERVTDDRTSFLVEAALLSMDSGYWKVSAFGFGAGRRTYVNGRAPEGFFLAGSGGISFVSATYDDGWSRSSGSGTSFTASATAGYKWLGDGGFTTEVAAGISAMFGRVQAGGRTAPIAGFSPVLAVNVGYSW
jgi:hypothetical protein